MCQAPFHPEAGVWYWELLESNFSTILKWNMPSVVLETHFVTKVE